VQLTIDFQEDFIDVKSVAVATMSTLQATGIFGAELDAPEPDRFSADSDTSLSQKIFDITVTQIESEV